MADIVHTNEFDIKNGQLRKCLVNQKHIIIPESVSVVCEGAFAECNLLEMIEFPDSVRILVLGWGNNEFANCPALHTIKLGANLEQYNLKLKEEIKVVFPDSFYSFYSGNLSDDETIRLLYGIYSRNQGIANYNNFADVIQVYLTQNSPKVANKCKVIMQAHLETCLDMLNKQLPSLSGRKLELAREFIARYDRSNDQIISTIEEAAEYVKANLDQAQSKLMLDRLYISTEDLNTIRSKQSLQPVDNSISTFVFLFYMKTTILNWDHNCEQIIALLNENDLAKLCEKKYTQLIDYNSMMAIENKDFIRTYCRFASSTQIRAIKEKISIWQKMGIDGLAYFNYFTQSLALNKSLSALLLLDQLDSLVYAAQIRDISQNDLRENLIPDFGFDRNGSFSYQLTDRILQVTLNADLSLELFDDLEKKNIHAFPKEQDGQNEDGAWRQFNELKETLKEVRDNQLGFLKKQFIFGIIRNSDAWINMYVNNPVLRKLATGMIWRFNDSDNKKSFALAADGSFIDAQGKQWLMLKSGKISLAHPLYLTAQEMDFWIDYLAKEEIRQPIAQLSETIIPFSSIDDIAKRYLGIKVTYRMIKLMEEEAFKIYGMSKFGYQLDNDIVRLHFDFGLLKSLSDIDLDDDVYLNHLQAINLNRARPINHSLAVLDRLIVMAAIKEDHLNQLIAYIEKKNIGLDEDEIRQFLAIANHYQSFNCTAHLLNYKNKLSKFKACLGDLWL